MCLYKLLTDFKSVSSSHHTRNGTFYKLLVTFKLFDNRKCKKCKFKVSNNTFAIPDDEQST